MYSKIVVDYFTIRDINAWTLKTEQSIKIFKINSCNFISLYRTVSSGISGASYYTGTFNTVNRSPDGSYVAVSSRGNFYLTWEPGQVKFSPQTIFIEETTTKICCLYCPKGGWKCQSLCMSNDLTLTFYKNQNWFLFYVFNSLEYELMRRIEAHTVNVNMLINKPFSMVFYSQNVLCYCF